MPTRSIPWARAWLWLLLALLPLRGLASVEMMTMSAAGPSTVHASSLAGLPDCHGLVSHGNNGASQAAQAGAGPVDDTHAPGDPPAAADYVCIWSLFCAPALPGAVAAMPGLPPASGASPMHRAGPAPDVVLEPLFKPPRG